MLFVSNAVFFPHKFYFQLLHKASYHAATCFGYLLYPSSWSYNTVKTRALQHGLSGVSKGYQNLGPKLHQNKSNLIREAITKFPELWYSTVMVGHMTTLT